MERRRERVIDHPYEGKCRTILPPLHTTMSDHHSLLFLCPQVRCMKLVQHPNVVRLYEVIDTQTKLYLILELGDGGDLYDYIMRHDSGLSEEVYISRSFQHIPLNDPVLPEKMKSFCRHWLRAEVFLSPPFFPLFLLSCQYSRSVFLNIFLFTRDPIEILTNSFLIIKYIACLTSLKLIIMYQVRYY